MHKRISAAILWPALIIILAFHLTVAWQDMPTLARNGFLYDDSFYAFNIARNIADGKGMTFDGIHPTTGFQPLYVFLIVPAYMVSGDNLIMPIYFALSLLSLFTCMTAYLIFRIASRYAGVAASGAAALLWAFSPVVTKQSANGLETAVAAFMITLSVFYYLDKVRNENKPSIGRLLTLGLILGLAVLSRIDSGLLVMVIFLDYLVMLRRRSAPAKAALNFLVVPLGVLVLYGPWLLFNMIESGSPIQDSGTATRFLSLAYSSYFDYGSADMAVKGPDPAFIRTHIFHSISIMKVIPPVHVLFRMIDKLGATLGVGKGLHSLGNILGYVLLGIVGFSISAWRRDPAKRARTEIDFFLGFVALLLVSYSVYIFGIFFFLRYYYPVYIIATLFFAFIIQDVIDWIRPRHLAVRRAAIAVAAVYLVLYGAFSWSQTYRSHPVYPFYDVAQWVDENTDDGERVGVFQAGMIGYFSHRQIVNLDGKVNREALCALKDGCLEKYIEKEKIDVLVDHAAILDIFLGISSGDMKGSCTDIYKKSMVHPSGWIAFRKDPDAVDATADSSSAGGGSSSGALFTRSTAAYSGSRGFRIEF